jgi:hypothetical protein
MTEVVPETSVSTCNQLTRLCSREDFIDKYACLLKYANICITVNNICFENFAKPDQILAKQKLKLDSGTVKVVS